MSCRRTIITAGFVRYIHTHKIIVAPLTLIAYTHGPDEFFLFSFLNAFRTDLEDAKDIWYSRLRGRPVWRTVVSSPPKKQYTFLLPSILRFSFSADLPRYIRRHVEHNRKRSNCHVPVIRWKISLNAFPSTFNRHFSCTVRNITHGANAYSVFSPSLSCTLSHRSFDEKIPLIAPLVLRA